MSRVGGRGEEIDEARDDLRIESLARRSLSASTRTTSLLLRPSSANPPHRSEKVNAPLPSSLAILLSQPLLPQKRPNNIIDA